MNTGFEDAGSVYGGVILSNDPLILTSDVLLTQSRSVESARLLVNKLSAFVVWISSVSRSLQVSGSHGLVVCLWS